jgi:uncharacterized protein (TIGR00290 family)
MTNLIAGEKVAMSWSGGKDSALALHALLESGCEVAALLTTIADGVNRVSHHGVREDLLDAQAAALGIPLVKVRLPNTRGGSCSNPEYESAIAAAMFALRDRTVAHGDLFLADLRRYREQNLERAGMRAIFPLWGIDTTDIILRFVESGFKATLCCVDDRLGSEFVGSEIDETFLASLPQYVDPAGENGEYHSFVHDGPIFRRPIRFRRGERVVSGGRTFLDLLPESSAAGVPA